MEEKDKLYLQFSYTNMFGNNTHLNKEVGICAVDCSSEYDVLVNEFKNFLITCGFSENTISTRIT